MTIPGDIIIPALTFRSAGGDLDEVTTARYAETAAGTWLDYFILSGTTTEGDSFTVDERAQVLDIWLNTTEKSRLVACCWTRADIDAALERGIRPMGVMRDLHDENEAIAFFKTLPAGAYVYSHPLHTSICLTADVIKAAVHHDCLPAGAKISKLPAPSLPGIRAAAACPFSIWDGSSRHVSVSLSSGADGVVATCLAALPNPFPTRTIKSLQQYLNTAQLELDRRQTPSTRIQWLKFQFHNAQVSTGEDLPTPWGATQ